MIEASSDARWIVLGTDGRHVTLGRHADPTENEVAAAEVGLARQGLSGWLVVMNSSYYGPTQPSLILVRALCDPEKPFSEAVLAFQATREKSLQSLR